MGIYSDNYYSWMDRIYSSEKAAMDEKFDEAKHSREAKGSEKGGRFKTKPETIEQQDDIDPDRKMHYRDIRDSLAHKLTEDGTFDLDTGEPVEFKTGFQVSFQEETTERKGHGAYIDDDEYDRRVEALSKELGAKPNLARFGEPEISFHVESLDKALEVARRHNQESVWDWENLKCQPNKDFVGRTHYADRDNHTGKNYHSHKELLKQD